MEKISEFEEYLLTLAVHLSVAVKLKDEICRELRQALYEKYNEMLIKGYSSGDSIAGTLIRFENPVHLAQMFNRAHCQNKRIRKIGRILHIKKAAFIAAIIRVIMVI